MKGGARTNAPRGRARNRMPDENLPYAVENDSRPLMPTSSRPLMPVTPTPSAEGNSPDSMAVKEWKQTLVGKFSSEGSIPSDKWLKNHQVLKVDKLREIERQLSYPIQALYLWDKLENRYRKAYKTHQIMRRPEQAGWTNDDFANSWNDMIEGKKNDRIKRRATSPAREAARAVCERDIDEAEAAAAAQYKSSNYTAEAAAAEEAEAESAYWRCRGEADII